MAQKLCNLQPEDPVPQPADYPITHEYAAAGRSGGKPVICGGWTRDQPYDHDEVTMCYVYEATTNTWELLAQMSVARAEFGFAQLNEDDFMVVGE